VGDLEPLLICRLPALVLASSHIWFTSPLLVGFPRVNLGSCLVQHFLTANDSWRERIALFYVWMDWSVIDWTNTVELRCPSHTSIIQRTSQRQTKQIAYLVSLQQLPPSSDSITVPVLPVEPNSTLVSSLDWVFSLPYVLIKSLSCLLLFHMWSDCLYGYVVMKGICVLWYIEFENMDIGVLVN
jgi:hypothetical protein